MTITFPCSACGRQYKAEGTYAGKQIKCKKCGAVIRVPMPRHLAPSPPQVPAHSADDRLKATTAPAAAAGTSRTQAATPLHEEVTCPNCRAACRVLPEWRGKTLECPTCRGRFVVPAATTSLESAPLTFVSDDSSESASAFIDEESAVAAEPPAIRHRTLDWLDGMFRRSTKRQRTRHVVQQSDCPFGVLVMGILLVGIQLVTALLAVVSMVRGAATPELWGRLAGSLIGLGIAWGYLNGHKMALRLYQFFGGIQIVALVAALVVAWEVEPAIGILLGLVVTVAVAIYFYNFTPMVESYFRGRPVSYSSYLGSWHFFVPLSACLVGVMSGYALAQAFQEEIERERWALNADPEQVLLMTVANVADAGAKSQIETRVRQLLGNGAESRSEWQESRQRLKMAVAPVLDVATFSQRIDFGTVKTMKGRTIEIVADLTALERLAKADEERRQEEARRNEELAAAARAKQEERDAEIRQKAEEARKRQDEFSAKLEKDRQEWDKKSRQIASGPGWDLERKPGKPGSVFTHHQLGYRIMVPVFWELNNTVNNLPTVNSSDGRVSVFGFASSHARSTELGAVLRVETYPSEGEESPVDTLKRWEKDRRGNSSYKRSGTIQEQKLGDLNCAGLPYSWKDRRSDAEFETWVVRRDQTLYVVTIGANRRELNWSKAIKDLRESLQSFELMDTE